MDFIGIGAARCSTTWIHECLNAHPQISMPLKKELHFFDNDNNYNKGIKYYENQISHKKHEIVKGEMTPRYILYKPCMEKIKNHYPESKIIISLRNPVERTVSQYKYFKLNKKKEPNVSLLKAMESSFYEDYILKSLYCNQIINVYSVFEESNVIILYDNEIYKNPKESIKKLYRFLGVETEFLPDEVYKKFNASKNVYCEPRKIWARVKQIQNPNNRFINDVFYGQKFGNIVSRVLLKNKFAIKTVNYIDRMHNSDARSKSLVVNEEDKKYLYYKYFLHV